MAKLKSTTVTGDLSVSGNISGKTNASELNRGTVPRERLTVASTGGTGIVQLNDAVNSTSTTQAATPNAVKKANDNANTKLSLSGGTMTGQLNLTNKSVNPSFGTTKTGNDAASTFPAGLSVYDSSSNSASGWGGLYGSVLNISAGSLDRQSQINISNGGKFHFRYSHTNNAATSKWSEWYDLYHSGNKPPTLATARQINGTNFDGSANITTSKWGTARTLSLGGDLTGSASLDGSSNVTLSAQVTNDSHNHTYLNGKNHGVRIFGDHDNGNVTLSASKSPSGTVGDLYLGYTSSSNFTKDVLLGKNMKWQSNGSVIVDSNGKVPWTALTGIPSSFNPSSHTHDDRYLRLTGGTLTGNVTFSNDSVLEWNRNTDWGKIFFKNDADGDTDSFLCFESGDNGDEYFKFRTKSGASYTDLLTIKTDHLRYKGNTIYHQGFKPTPGEIGALASSGGMIDGNLGVNRYLQLWAWPGFGSGAINLWANKGGNGALTIDGCKDIQVDGNWVYHQGYKPTPSEIGAAEISGGRKIFCQGPSPNPTAVGDLWISW